MSLVCMCPEPMAAVDRVRGRADERESSRSLVNVCWLESMIRTVVQESIRQHALYGT